MNERPILFSAPMVRAILDGRKTQTRRVMKPQPAYTPALIESEGRYIATWGRLNNVPEPQQSRCPYGLPGDRLWVRESFRALNRFNSHPIEVGSWCVYEADVPHQGDARPVPIGRMGKLRPGIHMPRWASRITLDVADIRVERLHAITEADAKAEGADKMATRVPTARDAYRYVWEDINGRESWAANPWVWVVTFTRTVACHSRAGGVMLVPVNRDQANDYVRRLHRHSKPVQGYRFAVGLAVGDELRGVAIAGRPVARGLDDGKTIEILRVCTDGIRNGCTRLYGACCRAAEAMGYHLAVTYTLESEGGASLRAAGFERVAEVRDRQWDTPSRPREQRELIGGRIRWQRRLVREVLMECKR